MTITSFDAVPARTEADAAGSAPRLSPDMRSVALLLAAVAALLALAGVAVHLVIHEVIGDPSSDVSRALLRFDLGHEPSVPAWFSASVLLLNGLWLLVIARAEALKARPMSLHWAVLGAVFVGLSLDEAALFHELIDTLLARQLGTDGVLTFPWVIAGLSFVALIALAYLRFLLALPRRFAALFVGAGALFVGGAVGMEMASALAIDAYGSTSLAHLATQTVEESLEMAGSILFFYALSLYWSDRHGDVSIRPRA